MDEISLGPRYVALLWDDGDLDITDEVTELDIFVPAEHVPKLAAWLSGVLAQRTTSTEPTT